MATTTTKTIMPLLLIAAVLFVPVGINSVYAQTINEEEDNADTNIPGDIIPTGPINPVGIVNELNQAYQENNL